MAKMMKVWTSLGIAAIANIALAQGALAKNAKSTDLLNLAAAAGGAGEGGGEGGGDAPVEYSLGSTDANAFNFDARPQMEAYAELVVSSYLAVEQSTKTLQAAVDALLANPSAATLTDARKAWVAARPSYLVTEAYRFYNGPIDEAEGRINSWPVNEAYIDYVDGKADAGIINDPSQIITAAAISGLNQASDEKNVTTGWHAVEFLLWGQDLSAEGPGNRPYTDYIAGAGNNDRRRKYLGLVTSQLAGDIANVTESWELEEPDNYARRFLALKQREALGRMINGMAILAGHELMSERISVALDSGDQEDEQSCFSDSTHQDFVHDLAGIKAVWTGDSAGVSRAGLDGLVRSLDAALADKIDALLADAEAKIGKLGDPWDRVLASAKDSPERKDAEAVVTALQDLGSGLVEAGNKLGVLVLIPGAS